MSYYWQPNIPQQHRYKPLVGGSISIAARILGKNKVFMSECIARKYQPFARDLLHSFAVCQSIRRIFLGHLLIDSHHYLAEKLIVMLWRCTRHANFWNDAMM